MNIEQQNQARENIKRLMEEQGLTQPKLSEKAGIAFGTLSRILRGKQDLTIQTAEKIADALGLSVYDLTENMSMDYSELDSFVIYICMEGSCTVTDNEGNTLTMQAGESVLFPATTQSLEVVPQGNVKFLETYV